MTNLKDLPLSHPRPSDTLMDVMTFLRISSQILSEGGISDQYAAEISWLLGSHKKRLEPLMDLIERLEDAGAVDITPEVFKADLAIMTEIDAAQAELAKIRKEQKA